MNNSYSVFTQIPSLVINVTDICNMECLYCPPYGENVESAHSEYDEKAILHLIRLAHDHNFRMVRFTGGEPFLEPDRLERFLLASIGYFDRVQVNTNGTFDKKHFDWLIDYKQNLLLKFSLDTINNNEFITITRKDYLRTVLDNIDYAISLGFNNITLNAVLSIQSLNNVIKTIEYAVSRKLNMKLLTVSSFCGAVHIESSDSLLSQVINYLSANTKNIGTTRLLGGRGICMLTYQIGESEIILVDHSCCNSKTPSKIYFASCQNNCKLFPCESGAISITISANGCISVCRGNKTVIGNVFFIEQNETEKLFELALSQFNNCVEINVNNL